MFIHGQILVLSVGTDIIRLEIERTARVFQVLSNKGLVSSQVFQLQAITSTTKKQKKILKKIFHSEFMP